jgi:hypothetical protein
VPVDAPIRLVQQPDDAVTVGTAVGSTPDRPPQPVDAPEPVHEDVHPDLDQHVDGMPIIENVNAAAPNPKERNDMTDEERLELAYLRQRITAFEKKFGVDADDPPPQPQAEPVGDNVVRLRRRSRMT